MDLEYKHYGTGRFNLCLGILEPHRSDDIPISSLIFTGREGNWSVYLTDKELRGIHAAITAAIADLDEVSNG